MKILFVIPPNDSQTAAFTQALKNALRDCEITISDAKIRTLLFDTRRYDLVHYFGRASKLRGKIRSVQTILSRTAAGTDYSDRIITLSESTKGLIEQRAASKKIEVIPPCVELPDPTRLQPASVVRQRYNATDRMLVVALNDMQNQKEFDSFLYIAREYNRRDVFRFLIPVYGKTKAADSWRSKLQYSIDMEKLDSVTILKDDQDFHSLIDASDMSVLVTRREETDGLEFPLRGIEALLLGKPVLCFAQSAFSEVIRKFKSNWVTSNTEDFIRESRDIQKEESRLEEIATELARFARSRFNPGVVAAEHQKIYNELLKNEL